MNWALGQGSSGISFDAVLECYWTLPGSVANFRLAATWHKIPRDGLMG